MVLVFPEIEDKKSKDQTDADVGYSAVIVAVRDTGNEGKHSVDKKSGHDYHKCAVFLFFYIRFVLKCNQLAIAVSEFIF